jgi:hypothetical protein
MADSLILATARVYQATVRINIPNLGHQSKMTGIGMFPIFQNKCSRRTKARRLGGGLSSTASCRTSWGNAYAY